MEFYDDYKLQSGWIHDYYCDIDGAELIFDLDNAYYFECPICHKKYTDLKRKRAWVTKYRYEIFNKIEEYSEKYLVEKNHKYLQYIINALEYYTTNYDKFPIHNKEGEIFDSYINKSNRCGRITAQGLNEAMITIQIVNCISNLSEYLPKKLKEDISSKLFPNIFNLSKPQVNKIHNIKCYEICSIGMMGIISNNKEMIDFAFKSQYSFYNQLKLGTTKENFWNEGSFHYHLFVLKPILQLLNISEKYKYEITPNVYTIAKNMLLQAFTCSFSDCSLPSPNDGWPNKHLQDYLKTYQIANNVYSNEFDNIINMIKQKENNSSSVHLLDTGFSILKNQYWNVFIKYKDNNINHSHPDKLNIEIKIGDRFLTHDLSTSGYGSKISSSFYKKTYSHNTIVVNGMDQNLECTSEVKEHNHNTIEVKVINSYSNIAIARKLNIDDKKLYDEVSVECAKDEKIDYFFHCDAKLLSSFEFTNIDKLEEYPYLTNIKKCQNNDGTITLKWELDNKEIINEIDIKNKELYICKSPDNPKNKERTTFLIRNKDKQEIALFKLCWTIAVKNL